MRRWIARAHIEYAAAAAVHHHLRRGLPRRAGRGRRAPADCAGPPSWCSPSSPSRSRLIVTLSNWRSARRQRHRRRLGGPRRPDLLHLDDPAGLRRRVDHDVRRAQGRAAGSAPSPPQAAAVPGTAAEREAIAARLGAHRGASRWRCSRCRGMMLFPASNDLITMFVALEILSLPLYLLCGLARRRRLLSQEAALKYFLLGALSSAFFIYGAALLYGYSGSFTLSAIDDALSQQPARRARVCCWPAWRCSASGCCSSSVRCRSTPGPPTSTPARRPRSPDSWRRAPRSPPSAP